MAFVAAAATVGLVAPQLADSAPTQDPRAQREQVRAERAAVAARIDTSEASLSEIDAALQTLEDNLRTQQGALTRTEAQVAQAKQDIADAEAAIDKLTGKVAVLKDEMRRRAVQAYVSPPGDDVLTVLETNDFTTASTRKFYIELRAQKDADVADRLNGAASDLAYQKRKATDAKALADTKQAEQKKRTEAVADAEADQQQISDNLESTIDSEVARSIKLAKTDRALSAKIAKQQAALVARLAAQKAAQEEADKKAASDDAARKAAAKAADKPPPVVDSHHVPPRGRHPFQHLDGVGLGVGTDVRARRRLLWRRRANALRGCPHEHERSHPRLHDSGEIPEREPHRRR